MRHIYCLTLIIVLVFATATTACESRPQVGSIITFAGNQWRILDTKGKRALIISELIIEQREYHYKWQEVSWADCSLREYLNTEYYNKNFTSNDQARIIATNITNPANPWYHTEGGEDTIDKIFLLSLSEVVKYFGDSGDLKNKKGWAIDNSQLRRDSTGKYYNIIFVESPQGYSIIDSYNQARQARDAEGKELWWWLRSPGHTQRSATDITFDGKINVGGGSIDNRLGGVRPALWINL